MSRTQLPEHASSIADSLYGKWLYCLAAIPPIAALLTVLLAPHPHGHWSEHLWGAYLALAQLVLIVTLATLLMRRHLSVLLPVVLAVVAVGIVYEILGNFQVASSIWRTSGNPGFGSGYTQGHERAETGDLLVTVGGAAFALIAGLTQRAPVKVAGLALVMVVIPPPWMWPGAGVLMLLLYCLTSKAGRTVVDRPRQTTIPAPPGRLESR